jgi:SNF2 family DNA or RNA helicase
VIPPEPPPPATSTKPGPSRPARRSPGERFEWLETEAPQKKAPSDGAGVRAETARRCPRCGWLDAVSEAECFRCGHVFASDAVAEELVVTDLARALAARASTDRRKLIVLDPKALFEPGENDAPAEVLLRRRSAQVSLIPGFEKLLALTHVNPEIFRDYVHQRVVAEKALRELGGAALLADETGLGKTMEAGIIAAELIVRGLVRTVLVVVPASLSHQWREEMHEKFALDFRIVRSSKDLVDDPPLKIVSYTVLRSERAGKVLREQAVDLLVCDEAHHLKNRSTKQYRAVNRIQKKYVLLLSATPFHNRLVELKSLIDVLKPGLLGSTRAFNKQYVDPKDPRRPRNVHHLRTLLAEVLIRNRRHEVAVKLPPRRAVTYHLELGPDERAFYDDLSDFIRQEVRDRVVEAAAARHDGRRYSYVLALVNLQRELTSSAPAVAKTLRLMISRQEMAGLVAKKLEAFAERAEAIPTWRKGDAALEVLGRFPGQFVVFCEFLATIDKLCERLRVAGIEAVPFHGGLGSSGKQLALERFKAGARVLVASRAGGEGLNIQFCHQVLNFDLPWNPMAVEQRIGRVHRLGQTQPVTVVNLSVRETIEARVLELLTYKLKLFTAVLGEIDLILGALHTEKSFEELLRDAWLKGLSEEDLDREFDKFGQALERAREEYDTVKESEQILDVIVPKAPETSPAAPEAAPEAAPPPASADQE